MLPLAIALLVITPGDACTRDWLLRRELKLADDVFCGVHDLDQRHDVGPISTF